MKRHESSRAVKLLVAVIASLVLCVACAGSDTVAAPAASVSPVPTEAPPADDEVESTVVQVQPTATLVPVVVSDEDRIAAAYAAFDAEPEPAELVAWDFSEPRVNDAGLVSFAVCGWDGQGVFDQVYAAVYETTTTDDGTISTRRRDVAIGAGECLNTALIDSVFEFITEVDETLAFAFENPDEFLGDAASTPLITGEFTDRLSDLLSESSRSNLTPRHTVYGSGKLPDAAATSPLWRRYRDDEVGRFEVAACRLMHPSYGLYRDEILIDDRQGQAPGPHSIAAYVLRRPVADDRWLLEVVYDAVWGDCDDSSDRDGFLERLGPDSAEWQQLET